MEDLWREKKHVKTLTDSQIIAGAVNPGMATFKLQCIANATYTRPIFVDSSGVLKASMFILQLRLQAAMNFRCNMYA